MAVAAGRRAFDRKHEADRITGVWQSIVGFDLPPESLQRFRPRPEIDDLCWYPDETFRSAGTRLWQGTGRLLLGA
jgi:hypothetical protein